MAEGGRPPPGLTRGKRPQRAPSDGQYNPTGHPVRRSHKRAQNDFSRWFFHMAPSGRRRFPVRGTPANCASFCHVPCLTSTPGVVGRQASAAPPGGCRPPRRSPFSRNPRNWPVFVLAFWADIVYNSTCILEVESVRWNLQDGTGGGVDGTDCGDIPGARHWGGASLCPSHPPPCPRDRWAKRVHLPGRGSTKGTLARRWGSP